MANTLIAILHEYQKFIENELIKSNYSLVKAPAINKQGIDKPQMVIPAVTTGCLPHNNFSLYGAENEFFQAPYILIGFEDNDIDYEESKIQLLIQVCCYSSSGYIQDPTDESFGLNIPDNKAFEDVINLLEWIRQKLIKEGIIAGTTIERPIKIGSYNSKELTYPYSFGYLSLSINSSVQETARTKFNY
jgi:hypothetical protein